MPEVARLGDVCTGHGWFPSRANVQGSPNVYVNGIPAHRQGDSWATHCCGKSWHSSSLAAGSSTVYVNGAQLGYVGAPVSCGSSVASGSPNVYVGAWCSMALFGCLPQKGNNGDFKQYEGLEVILQSIFVILNTPKGARVWQPEFGCGVMSYIWDFSDSVTIDKMRSEIESALIRWEPRITITSIDVELNPYKEGVVDVTIDFNYAGKDYSKNLSLDTTNNMDLTVYNMHY